MNIWDYQRILVRRLIQWALISLGIGTLLSGGNRFWRGVSGQFIAWALINLGIAYFGITTSENRRVALPDPLAPEVLEREAESLRRAGAQFVESVVGYHSRLERRRCLPDVTPAQVRAEFTQALSQEGETAEAILADWNRRVEPLLTAVGSPRHFPFVNGSGSMIGPCSGSGRSATSAGSPCRRALPSSAASSASSRISGIRICAG